MNKQIKNEKNTKYLKYFIIGIICVIISFIIYNIILLIIFSCWEQRGQYGDMFGALNAFFSALALLGVIFAIYLQKKDLELQRTDLKLQRDELSLNREEFKGQKEQLKIQSTTLEIQRIETTLFNMITLYHNIVESLTEGQTKDGFSKYTGKEFFYRMQRKLNKMNDSDTLWRKIDHYIVQVFNIFTYILINDKKLDKQFYSNIFKSQVSDAEKVVIREYLKLNNTEKEQRNQDFRNIAQMFNLYDV